jgi:methyl-accepting chemotaxis protein
VLLAFLLCYRDWRPIVVGAGVAAVHHLSFNYFQQLGYGVMCFTKPGLGIVFAHASYVIVETVVLSWLAVLLKSEERRAAELLAIVSSLASRHEGKINLATLPTDSRSEAAAALQAAMKRIHGVISTINRSAGTVVSAAQATSSGSHELAGRTEQQRSAFAQTTESLARLTVKTRENAQQAEQAAQMVEAAAKVATQGGVVVARVVETMNSISASSRQIAEINGVIDEIGVSVSARRMLDPVTMMVSVGVAGSAAKLGALQTTALDISTQRTACRTIILFDMNNPPARGLSNEMEASPNSYLTPH